MGKQTHYQFELIQNIKRIKSITGFPSTNCPDSNSSFTYDTRGLLTTKTDNNGNITTYLYNDRGLETSRTEASGTSQARTTTTEWHPTLYSLVRINEPDRSIHYTYDTQGRQLSKTIISR
ncbi:RHS Repeat protein [compost metagenome]